MPIGLLFQSNPFHLIILIKTWIDFLSLKGFLSERLFCLIASVLRKNLIVASFFITTVIVDGGCEGHSRGELV